MTTAHWELFCLKSHLPPRLVFLFRLADNSPKKEKIQSGGVNNEKLKEQNKPLATGQTPLMG